MEDIINSPVFIAYAKCVVVLAVKMSFTAWTTVYFMFSSGWKGMRNPEDLLQGLFNLKPHPDQLKPYEPTEKQRRIMGHDLENNVPFFAVGLLYCLLNAGDEKPLYVYTGTKLLHHLVYWSGQRHEVRAAFWTVTNSAFLYMAWLVWTKL